MSFVVKYRSFTSGGREIVRPNEIDKTELTIGRGADCDILLTDLSVTPHHARVALVGRNRITIESESEKNLPFYVDGRQTTRADINPARGAVVRIGPHLLTVSMGTDGEQGRVVILVEREEEEEAADADKLFSLAGKLPGKRISAWGFALLILVACLAWPIWTYSQSRGIEERSDSFHADTMWTSGPLSEAHANLENDCQACHQNAFVSVRDSACQSCHTDVHDHAEDARMAAAEPDPGLGRGFLLAVADAFNRPRRSCASCHAEHEGAGAMAPAPQRFCSDCHADLDARLTDTAFLNAGDFGDDHPEFRPRVMTTPGDLSGGVARYRRVSLSDEPREDTGLKFPHELHLSRSNGVARMAQRLGPRYGFGEAMECADCHVPTADGTRFEPITMEANCQMCHSLAFDRIGGTVRTLRHGEPEMVAADIRAFYRSTAPRRPVDLSGMSRRRPGEDSHSETVGRYQFAQRTRYNRADSAIRAAFSDGGACFDCHRVQRTASAAAPYDVLPVRQIGRYMHSGWFDHAAHRTEDCATCHEAGTSDSATDVLLPGIETCRECHGGASAGGDLVPSTCALCHSYHADDGAPYLVRARNIRGRRPQSVRDYSGLTIRPARSP